MYANPPEAEFQRTISKLRTRNKISSLLDVYVLHETRNLAFSSRGREKRGKECTKKCDARAKLLFCLLNLFFSSFLRSRCRPFIDASLDLEVPIQNMRKRYWREQRGKIFHINTL